MTTNQANTAIKNLTSLKAHYAAFVEEMEPHKQSFFKFVTENLHVAKWIHFQIEADGVDSEVEDFELDLNNTAEDGVMFCTTVNDYDGATSLSFVVPFAYIADPEAWKNEVLAKAARDQKLMEDIYDEVAPGIREELNLDIYINSVYSSGEVCAVVCHKGNTGISLGHPDTAKMVMNSFIVNVNSGELITRTLI